MDVQWFKVSQRVFGFNLDGEGGIQHVSSFNRTTLTPPPEFQHPALESRVLTGYVTAASLLALVVHALLYLYSKRTHQVQTSQTYILSHGGWNIFPFQVARLLANIALVALTAITAVEGDWSVWGDITLFITSSFSAVISTLLLLVHISKSRALSFHATTASLSIFAAYAYRNLWPLATFTLAPADRSEGDLLWAKIALSGIAGILVPFVEPYIYVPFDPSNPQEIANPEQTASLWSLSSFSFMSPLIFQARKVKHLSFDMLPAAVDTDKISALSRAASYLDPFNSPTRKISIYRALFRAFGGRFAMQALLAAGDAVAVVGSPIGVNKLLSYIETKGEGAIAKPWVWIVLITLAPMAKELSVQLYTYYVTRTATHIEAIITAVVYQHSLRVRVLNKADDEDKSSTTSSRPTTPNPEASPSGSQNGADAATVHSRSDTTTTATTVVAAQDTNAKGKPKDRSDASKPKKKDMNVVGRLQSLVTSDLASINGGKDWLICVVNQTLQMALGSWFLYTVLGWAAWVGLGTMILLAPIPALTGGLMNSTQKRKMEATDERVSYMKEILGILRMVKIFGWESRVMEQVDQRREAELRLVFRGKVLRLFSMIINHIIPLVHMIVTFAVYTVVMKKPLTASVVFSALTGFNMLRMALYMLMYFIPVMIQANVSLGRVQDFLNNTELLDRFSNEVSIQDSSATHKEDLGLGQASFYWSQEHASDGTLTPSRQKFRLRIEDDITFKKGRANLVVGPTGCGKTSLLMALLGEMHYVPSGPGAWINLPVEHGVAFCAQEAWIQSLSIKDNILFGAPFDEVRYKKVIYQCGLKRDLTLFDAGDLTEIGEKGLTLSGGQKARISLARAVYSSAQTLLLDDILAALDVHTSVWIVNKCLKGDLLKGRTIILVTHNLALTTPIAEYVVSLGTDGRIISHGKPVETVIADKALAEEIAHEREAIEMDEELEEPSDEVKASAKGSKLVVAEEIQEGHVSMKAVQLLLSNLSAWPVLFWSGYLAISCVDEAFEVLEMWWLGHWAAQYDISKTVSVAYYLGMYVAIVGVVVATYIVSTLMSTFASVRVSRIIHHRLAQSIMATTFRWLDTTPTSRIIARCTQDIESIDGQLVAMTSFFIAVCVMVVSRLAAVAASAPVFIVPGVAIGIVGALIGQLYMKAQLSVKRERSNAKAPVLAAINGAFSGLTSIRAFSAQAMFTTQSMDKVDSYSRVSIVFFNVNRWVAVRIQALSAAFGGGLAFYLVYGPGHRTRTASTIGFALTMAVDFSGQLLQLVRMYNALEVEGNSLERIQAYLDIEKEPAPEEGGVPPAYWPASGSLVVKDLTARYSADGPVVLDKVSFEIKSGERVGIVGRTGSGKSTLTLALLRCIVTEGEVYYDGIPTSALNLDALRSNVTIIPQAPELLSGSLRKNLDMFGQHNDAELNDALRSAGLFALQSDADENRLTLDSQIAASGGNLSVGQRQIIALARAIVRQSKILVLDEATSAIDYETDTIIQESLRTELSGDVTVLTVAHRLQTVMDSDKIMVLDAGKLIEFDSPKKLLQTEGSLLRSLVDESSDKEALYALAERHTS